MDVERYVYWIGLYLRTLKRKIWRMFLGNSTKSFAREWKRLDSVRLVKVK